MEEIDKIYLSKALKKTQEAIQDLRRVKESSVYLTHAKIALEKALRSIAAILAMN